VENGGSLQSSDAVPLGIELIEAFADLAKEFPAEKKTTTGPATVAALQTIDKQMEPRFNPKVPNSSRAPQYGKSIGCSWIGISS